MPLFVRDRPVRSDALRAGVKVALVALALGSGHALYALRLDEIGGTMAMLPYAALFVASCVVVLALAFVRRPAVRWGWAVFLALAFGFGDATQRILGEYLTYFSFVQLLDAHGFLLEALVQFAAPILVAVGFAALLLAGIGIGAGRASAVPALPASALAVAFLAALPVLVYVRGGAGTSGLPAFTIYPPYVALAALESARGEHRPREPVTLPLAARVDRDVVLLVDESVRGDYLDINAAGGVRSGLAEARDGVRVDNLGLAVSITNCSHSTNHGLRYGGTRDNYRDALDHLPSIWSHARAAGLRPVYIDAQRTDGLLQNNMDRAELDEIDEFVQFDDVPVLYRDMAVAAKLEELLANGVPEFVYVNKLGAHFPVDDKYPDEYLVHRPALPRGRRAILAFTTLNDGFGERWDLYRNSYRNTLLWTVGAFFDELLADADLGDGVILYTADHGQDFRERGNPGLNTHCSADPNVEEAIVPLALLSGEGTLAPGQLAAMAGNVDAASHYNLFPTLLALMGYEPGAVARTYGPSVFEPVGDQHSFNLRFEANLGKPPVWRAVDLRDLAPVTPVTGGTEATGAAPH